ncbi:MAG: peptidylprolyl isomerase [Flavobacteriaceae bacterium]|nr:peptidylprolyl isomerase [Flavobacteriaceae bacterium]
MAVLSKIRERSIFLIIVIAMALFAFVLGDLFKYKRSDNLVGEIDGEPISREQFSKEVELYKTRSNNKSSQIKAAKTVWNNIVREKIFQKQLRNAGIVVGEEDVWRSIIEMPYINGSPLFKNDAGLFDEEKFKEFLVTLKENAETNPNDKQWAGWLETEKNIKRNLEQSIYTGLIKNGISTTLDEGKNYYFDQVTKSDIEYVYVPFRNVPDSIFKITDSEVMSYIKDRKEQFQVEASRDLIYVNFDILPTKEDEDVVKLEVSNLINDKEEYSSAAKTTVKVLGFKNTTDDKSFFNENNSDLTYSEDLLSKDKLPKIIADKILSAKVGDIIGPYKEDGYYKLTKIKAFKQMPDSVKASHILISYRGALRSTDQKTEAQAKKVVDSLFKLVKNNKRKFAEVAKTMSLDKKSGAKGGELKWFQYGTMVSKFRDFVFLNKKGKIGIVKTKFGYHIIRIDNQKSFKKAYIVTTFGRKIEASENTENDVFEKAETFTSNVSGGKNFVKQARGKNYTVKPVSGVKILDETFTGLKNQRQIINWAFKKDTEIGGIKRFDTDNGYIVVQLNSSYKKGLMSVQQARIRVKRILLEQKKAAYIKKEMGEMPLAAIATKFKTSIRSSLAVSLASPLIPSVGRSLGLVGAINASKAGDILRGVKGKTGVFAVKIIKRETAVKLPNYDAFRKQIFAKLQLSSVKMYDALKNETEIVDNRALYY